MSEESTVLDLPFHDLESKRPSSQSLLRLYVYFLFLPFLHCSVTRQNEEVVAQSVNQGKSNEIASHIPCTRQRALRNEARSMTAQEVQVKQSKAKPARTKSDSQKRLREESEGTAPPAPQRCLQRRTGHATILFKKLLVKTSKIIIWKGNSLRCKTPQFCAVAKGTTTSTLQWYRIRRWMVFFFLPV